MELCKYLITYWHVLLRALNIILNSLYILVWVFRNVRIRMLCVPFIDRSFSFPSSSLSIEHSSGKIIFNITSAI